MDIDCRVVKNLNNNELKSRILSSQIIFKSYSRNRRLSDVIAETFRKEGNTLTLNEKRFITELVNGTVRMSGRLDWEISSVFRGNYKKLQDRLKIIMKIGLYQIRYMDSIPDYAAVSTTVKISKILNYKFGGLANAVLRSLLSSLNEIDPGNNSDINELAMYLSHPAWLIKRWIHFFSKDNAFELANWNNKKPITTFRVNSINYSNQDFITYLKEKNIEFIQNKHLKHFFHIKESQTILKSRIFQDGNVSVQDVAAALVVKLLSPNNNDIILDYCSAPGGKTTYISELLKNKGEIVAFDKSKERLNRLRNNIKRLKLTNIKIITSDIDKELNIKRFTKILVDAPCSGTGVLSKRADLRWRKSYDDILEMSLIQLEILSKCAKFLIPGGVLVYSTCSLEPEENWGVVKKFLKIHRNFKVHYGNQYIEKKYIDDKGALFTWPPKHGIDGGFAIRLKHNID